MLYHRLSVLVVDDSATIRKVVRKYLNDLGCRDVHEAENGAQALALTRGWVPSAIVSDFDMPVMNGSDLLGRVRSSPTLRRVPFVMATAHVVRFRDAGRDGGLTHFLAKPFTAADLKDRIDQGLSATSRLAA